MVGSVGIGALPIGGDRILKYRLAGHDPDDMVVVSFLGSIPPEFLNNTSMLARTDKQYDWRFIAGLEVCLLIRPGLPNVVRAMLDVARCKLHGRVYAWDVERKVGCELYALPAVDTIDRPADRWTWQLDPLPWTAYQNREFAP